MTPSSSLQVHRDGPVCTLQLDRPTKLNALDHATLRAIEHQFATWESDPTAQVVVVTSSAERAFCVGADLEVLSRLDAQTMHEWEMLGSRVLDRVQHSPLVSIAALRGHALGGGLTLAAACDFRLAADNSAFAQPEIGLGWIPGWSGVARLARLVGTQRAKFLCASARRIDAATALAWGLVDEVVPLANFDARVREFASQLGAQSRPALRAVKSLAAATETTLSPIAAGHDALLNAALLHDPRGQAAIASFLARKKST